MNNPYSHSGPPKMRSSFVCYADILGYTHLTKEAIRAGKGLPFLRRLREALSTGYARIRKRSKGRGEDPSFIIKVFTDNIVVGYPIHKFSSGDGESELFDVLTVLSEFQAGLAMKGFFLRGGVAFGDHYMDDDIVFGDALLQAVDQEKVGGPPRISLAPSVIDLVRRYLGYYGETSGAPQYQVLLEDVDGTIFLNYFGEAFYEFPEGGIHFELVKGHQQNIIKGLKVYEGNPGIRAKYEWAARYHNFICQEFAERYVVPTDPNTDEEYGAIAEEAQKLLDYIINIESLAAKPHRMNLIPYEEVE